MSRPQNQLSSYQKAIRFFWRELYATGGKTLYSQQRFGPSKPEWINIEHVFPMSWVVKSLNCRDRRNCRRYSDVFNFMLFSKQAKTLAYWNKADQPSKEEKRRNDIIQEIQGTRNYFIDNPDEIERLIKTNY